MNFKKKLQAAMPKMIGNPLSVATAMVSFALSVVKGQKAKKATKGKKKTTVRKSKIMSKKQQMEVMERICQSAYGTYIREVTTVAARYIGHPAVAIPASEMVKTMMEEAALPVSRPFVTITSEQMNSLKIEERKGEKEYIKTKDKSEERERLPFSKPIRDMGLLWNRMWGYEDDAPVAGQPFYDIVELYGDFKKVTNDFSDYLEKEINDWAKGLDEDYKNRELAKPASMRSDFGDAITGLTSGKEDNLSFGGKAGAFLRGLLVDGCGKLLIKDTLLAASSPCDTAKSVMETVKLVGDMDEEDFSKIAKEIKTTWDEASEEEKLNYTGQAGAIVADFLIAKKLKLSKQVKVIETGVKTGSKVDNLLEAGVKASSKVDDAAKAGAKASSKADDVAEVGMKASSKMDDIAEAGAKANSKANDTAKTAGQTTAITVVKENSGVNGHDNVKFSEKKPNTNVDEVKVINMENNKIDRNESPISDISKNNQKIRTLRDATLEDAELIYIMRKKYNAGETRNVAIARGTINGESINLESISGKFTHDTYHNKGNFEPPLPKDYHYQGPYGYIDHTEQKIVEYLRENLKNNPEVSGNIEIISERMFCDNCGPIVDMFEEEFPNIVVTRVEVFKYLQQSGGKK